MVHLWCIVILKRNLEYMGFEGPPFLGVGVVGESGAEHPVAGYHVTLCAVGDHEKIDLGGRWALSRLIWVEVRRVDYRNRTRKEVLLICG